MSLPAERPEPLPGDPVALLGQVFDFMADAVVVADAAGKIVFLDSAARRLIGIAEDAPLPADWCAIPGRYLSDGVTPVPPERVLVTRALRGEAVDREVFCFRDAAGARAVWVDGSARPIRGADGSIQGCVVVWRDVTLQRQLENDLRASEKRFAAIFNGISDAVLLVKQDGRIALANEAFGRLFGYAPEESLGRPQHFVHADGPTPGAAAEAGEAVVECRCRRKDGSEFWAEASTTRILGRDGGIVGDLRLYRDITLQRLAEAALRDQLEIQGMMTKIATTVPGVICSFKLRPDGSACMPFSSAALLELYGLQPEEVREDASELLARIDPEDIGRVNESIAESARTLRPWRAEYRVRHPGKGLLWVDGHSMPQREVDGSILWYGYLQDITARKHAEAELQRINNSLEAQVRARTAEAEARASALFESERFARATIDALTATLCVLDANGRIIAVNRAWRAFARENGGLPADLCEGTDYLAACEAAAATSPEAGEVARAIRAFLDGRDDEFVLEYACHSPSERRWFAMRLRAFPGDGPRRLVITHENVTARKLSAEHEQASAHRLKLLAAHLETVREEQSATIAREVHDELGGTLTMVKLGLATFAEELAAPQQATLGRILEQLDAALQTVKRISADLRPATLDTLGLVATIRWHAAQFAKMTGIAMDLRLPRHLRLSDARSTAIYRIVQEALTNIARHAEATRAFVAIRKSRGCLIVEVGDNGIGLTEATRHKPDSYGLIGMHERAHNLGGRLAIDGLPGGGTRVSLSLPLEEPRDEGRSRQ